MQQYSSNRPLRWYRSARRHRIGKARAVHVMTSTEPTLVRAADGLDDCLVWIGDDDRGIEVEVVVVVLVDAVVVIHVMPTALRRPR